MQKICKTQFIIAFGGGNTENCRAHNGHGNFRLRSSSATADDSPLFRVKDQRNSMPLLHARPALRFRRNVDQLEIAATRKDVFRRLPTLSVSRRRGATPPNLIGFILSFSACGWSLATKSLPNWTVAASVQAAVSRQPLLPSHIHLECRFAVCPRWCHNLCRHSHGQSYA